MIAGSWIVDHSHVHVIHKGMILIIFKNSIMIKVGNGELISANILHEGFIAHIIEVRSYTEAENSKHQLR